MSKNPYTYENASRIKAITRYLEIAKRVEKNLPNLKAKLDHIQNLIDNSPDEIDSGDLDHFCYGLDELAISLEHRYRINDDTGRTI